MHSFATSICSENNHQLFGIYFYQYTLNIKSIRKECTVRTINIIEYEFNFVLKYVLSMYLSTTTFFSEYDLSMYLTKYILST